MRLDAARIKENEPYYREAVRERLWNKTDVFRVEDIIEAINLESPPLARALGRSHEKWKGYSQTGESRVNKKGFIEIGGGMSDEENSLGREFFLKNTGIGKNVWGDNGKGIFTRSWAALDYIDENRPTNPSGGDALVDYAILNSAACTDVRGRKVLVKELTYKHVKSLFDRGQKQIIIDSMGCGEGDDVRYVLRCLHEYGIPIGEKGVMVRGFDISGKALKLAKEKAMKEGLSHAMEFHKIDILNTDNGFRGYPQSDGVLFVGFPDYFDDENIINVLGKGYSLMDVATKMLKPGGPLYTANIDHHDIGNHSIMGTVWWYLHERPEEYFAGLVEESGYECLNIHTTKNGVFNVVETRKQ